MAMTLGGIALPDLIIEDRLSHPGVRSSVTPTLAGGIIIQEFSQIDNRYVDLVGGDDYGWIQYSILQNIRSIAMLANTAYTLVYETETYTVRFRHEEPPVVYAEPIIPQVEPSSGDWWNNVTIKLMKVA